MTNNIRKLFSGSFLLKQDGFLFCQALHNVTTAYPEKYYNKNTITLTYLSSKPYHN